MLPTRGYLLDEVYLNNGDIDGQLFKRSLTKAEV